MIRNTVCLPGFMLGPGLFDDLARSLGDRLDLLHGDVYSDTSITGMARRVLGLMREAQANGIAATVSDRLAAGARLPGFGHPLYPDGDPRGRALLAGFDIPAAYAEARTVVMSMTGAEPNVDFRPDGFGGLSKRSKSESGLYLGG